MNLNYEEKNKKIWENAVKNSNLDKTNKLKKSLEEPIRQMGFKRLTS